MGCGCGKNVIDNSRPGAGDSDLNLRDTLLALSEPTWKNALVWLTFILAVLSFLRK